MNGSPLAHLVLQCWSFQSEALLSAALAGYSCGSALNINDYLPLGQRARFGSLIRIKRFADFLFVMAIPFA
jgi:hypothetical protein